MASMSGIDIEKAFDEKLPKLEEKFAPGTNAGERRREYRRTGKNKLYE